MDGRKAFAFLIGVAASCAGCVTETNTLPVSPETMSKMPAVKPQEASKRDGHPATYVAMGRVQAARALDEKTPPLQQNAARDEARKSFQKALDLNPKCVEAYVEMANLYVYQDDCERAIGWYQKGLQQLPQSSTLWFEAGVCYCRRKDVSQAVACMQKAHELDPENHHIARQYGFCLAWAGQHQQSATVLARVMSRPDACFNVARMLQHMQQPDLCRQYLQAALQERPTHQDSLQMLAQLDGRTQMLAPQMANQFDPNVQRANFQQR